MRVKLLAAGLALALAVPGIGLADPWKNESGHGPRRAERWDDRRDRERRDGYRDERWGDRRGHDAPSYALPRIPPGHLPPPGEYRAWFPDRPPGHQPPPQRW